MDMDDAVQPAVVQAFDNMTDDEAAAWVRAGDYTTVAGIRLPESVSKNFVEVLSSNEVEGFALGDPSAPAPVPIPYPNLGLAPKGINLSALYKHCAQGTHIPEVKIT